MQSTNRSGKRGRRACHVTPDLSYDYSKGEIMEERLKMGG